MYATALMKPAAAWPSYVLAILVYWTDYLQPTEQLQVGQLHAWHSADCSLQPAATAHGLFLGVYLHGLLQLKELTISWAGTAE